MQKLTAAVPALVLAMAFLIGQFMICPSFAEEQTDSHQGLAKDLKDLRMELDQLKATVARLEGSLSAPPKTEISKLRFRGVYVAPDGKRFLSDFTTSGPIASTLKPLPREITKVAADSKNKVIYGRGHQEVYEVADEEAKQLDAGAAADIGWLSAIAFDTKRGRLLASNFGGGGYLHAYNVKQKEWTIVCKPGLSVSAMAYVEAEDVLYGVELANTPDDYISKLYKFNAEGVRISEKELTEYVPTSGDFGSSQLVWTDGWLVLLQAQGDHRRSSSTKQSSDRAKPLQRGYVINPATAEVVYSWDNRPQ